MNIKIAVFSRYDRLGASSRLRFFQYYKYIREQRMEVYTFPLFDDDYLKGKYAGIRYNKFKIIWFYLKRFFQILTLYKYNVIIVEKEFFPYFPATIERILNFFNVRYIVDYDDAIFQMYEESSNILVRFFLRKKIDRVMSNSYCVIVGNDYLYSRSKEAGAKKISLIPTVVDIDRYKEVFDRQAVPTICWVGSPSTEKYIIDLKKVLIRVCIENQAKLILVGATDSISDHFPDINLEIVQWKESTEALIIQNSDIGIMPISDTNWELGKCGYKLIQYMASGKSVVASKIGANIDIVKDNCCGLLVSTEDEWYTALTALISDQDLSRRLGESGRFRVEEIYSVQSQFKELLKVINTSVL
jgi:glycosyltransferase involved in cell wall biosynthesis